MRAIEAACLGEVIERLVLDITTVLPEDVAGALRGARSMERSPAGRRALDMILENAVKAREEGVPICQDTGVFTIYVTLGEGTAVLGDLRGEASAAVARATAGGALRSSVVAEPLDARVNTGDNTPPLLEVEISPDGETTVAVLAKGGGSEMASRAAMLPPGAGWPGALEFVLGVVAEAGARSCPPLVLGVGTGGGFDRAPALAKRALLVPLDRENPDARTAAREAELVREVNALGIGPGALGGTVTCIGARIAQAPCHMASLPVAVSVNCHALRRKTARV